MTADHDAFLNLMFGPAMSPSCAGPQPPVLREIRTLAEECLHNPLARRAASRRGEPPPSDSDCEGSSSSEDYDPEVRAE